MFKNFTSTLSFFKQRIRISLLRSRIRTMNNHAYLDLWDRVELKKNIDLLNSLEQDEKFSGPSVYSMH